MKKILRLQSHSEAEAFQKQMKAVCPGAYISIFFRASKYHCMVSGTFTDTEIHKAAGLARIAEFKEVIENPSGSAKPCKRAATISHKLV